MAQKKSNGKKAVKKEVKKAEVRKIEYPIDCPYLEHSVMLNDCEACPYYLRDASYTGCGFKRDGLRGGEGKFEIKDERKVWVKK